MARQNKPRAPLTHTFTFHLFAPDGGLGYQVGGVIATFDTCTKKSLRNRWMFLSETYNRARNSQYENGQNGGVGDNYAAFADEVDQMGGPEALIMRGFRVYVRPIMPKV